MKKVRFSIADADFYFKEILVKNLLSDHKLQLRSSCNNGNELIRHIHLRQEDVFLIDLFMPIMSGIEAIKIIRNYDIQAPIIAYAATYQEDIAQILFAYPNVFYCQKRSNIIEGILSSMVFTPVNRYKEYLNEWKATSNIEDFLLPGVQKESNEYMPTIVEIQIMRLCYEGLSNKEIGLHLNLSARTIDTYIKRLTDKLNLKSKIDLIRYCVENGYYNSSL